MDKDELKEIIKEAIKEAGPIPVMEIRTTSKILLDNKSIKQENHD